MCAIEAKERPVTSGTGEKFSEAFVRRIPIDVAIVVKTLPIVKRISPSPDDTAAQTIPGDDFFHNLHVSMSIL